MIEARAALSNVRDECLFVVGGTHAKLVPYERAFLDADAAGLRPQTRWRTAPS